MARLQNAKKGDSHVIKNSVESIVSTNDRLWDAMDYITYLFADNSSYNDYKVK